MAVDGSENAQRAVVTAVELAKMHGATLTILNIVSIPVSPFLSDKQVEIDLSRQSEAMKTAGERMVDMASALAKASGVKARQEVVTHMGSIAEGITEFADKKGVGLIVIGTRGLSGLRKLLLGSVATGVVSSANCAVLVVR